VNKFDNKPPIGPIAPGELPVVPAPDRIWLSIEAALNAPEPLRIPSRWWQLAAAATLAVIAVVVYYASRPPTATWDIVRLDGAPSVDSKPLSGAGKIAVGDWLQTDATSRARINIGTIGTVDVEPDSRVRLVVARPTEHRLSLARGEISAVVSAPPRLFFVDLPTSTAVDLGCAYKMKVDDSGTGFLRVTLGWVSLEWGGRESLVPAGANCRTRPGIGPGTPYFADSPDVLQQALTAFDFDKGGIDVVLSQARVRDTLTLWHLLSRVDPSERAPVFDRMVELVPLPNGVTREKALQLDPATLKLWREELTWKW
jgi:hypothetical protein